MNVLLIDADSKIPNLALMKVAAYHKERGDNVGFSISDPDRIYCSIIYKKNRHLADGLGMMYPDAVLDIGGSGYDLKKVLPKEIESMTPDYSIYPENKSYYGFTTRGCIRHCPFCIVHDKEGPFRRLYDDPKAALYKIMGDAELPYITFLDNNILADKEWFLSLCDTLLSDYPKIKVDFNQGLDIRLMDDEIAEMLSKLHPIRDFKFAFDMMSYKSSVLKGIGILKKYLDVKNKCLFYV